MGRRLCTREAWIQAFQYRGSIGVFSVLQAPHKILAMEHAVRDEKQVLAHSQSSLVIGARAPEVLFVDVYSIGSTRRPFDLEGKLLIAFAITIIQ
jgi:hypothetical protein